MELVITNLSAVDPVMLPGNINLAAAASVTLSEQGYGEYLTGYGEMIADGEISVLMHFDNSMLGGGDTRELVADVIATANPTAGANTAVVGFTVKTPWGAQLGEQMVVQFGTYQDANGILAATTATLDTASLGTILSGAGTNELKVLTDIYGRFACTLTDTAHETVYQMCKPVDRTPVLDCRDYDAVTFAP